MIGGVSFGVSCSDLGESFGGCDTERDGYADALSYLSHYLFEVRFSLFVGDMVDVQIGFVDRVL